METFIWPDRCTGARRVLRYDDVGYELIVGDEIAMSRRLEAVCYLVDKPDRERIALIHGLQDAGEFGLARFMSARHVHS